ncbi:MAG: pyridoxamine 5'-phosphate oxidase family protein [Pirellulaceae bacterium]
MGAVQEEIDSKLANWLMEQQMFFVATAPLDKNGFVNCSPKGLDSFRVLAPKRVAYLDLHGSGVETIAHVRENARIVLMFCAFSGPPKIVRLHGEAKCYGLNSPEFATLSTQFPDVPGGRSIFEIDVKRVSVSCGFGVPRFDFVSERTALPDWAQSKGTAGLQQYRADHSESINEMDANID